jgi:hypothetical protein
MRTFTARNGLAHRSNPLIMAARDSHSGTIMRIYVFPALFPVSDLVATDTCILSSKTRMRAESGRHAIPMNLR